MSPQQLTWGVLLVALAGSAWTGAHHLTPVAPAPYSVPASAASNECEWIGSPRRSDEHEVVLYGPRTIESLSTDGRRAFEESVDMRAALARRAGAEFRRCFAGAAVLVEHQALATTAVRDLHDALREVAVLWQQTLHAASYCASFRECEFAGDMQSDALAAMENLAHRAASRGVSGVLEGVRHLALAAGERRPSWRSDIFAMSYHVGREEILRRRGECWALDAAYTEAVWRAHVEALVEYVEHATLSTEAPRLRKHLLPYNLCGERFLGEVYDPGVVIDRLIAAAASLERRRLAVGLRAY